MRVLGGPGEGKRSSVASELLGNLGELADLLNLGLALGRLERLDSVAEEGGVVLKTRILGDSIIVLACKENENETPMSP